MLTNIKKNPKCITTSIEDKLIILEFNSGIYFELNQIGMMIWDLIDSFKSSKEIIDILSKEFENKADIEKSVEKFLTDCSKKKLISFDA